ncbi:hypothetical protein V8C35DRAFT_279334 [Trichoderma chlorosporum]
MDIRSHPSEIPSIEHQVAQMHLTAQADQTAGMSAAMLEGLPGDYITDIEARREIFLKFKKFQDDHNIQLGLNAVGFAIFMVAPIDQLRHSIDALVTEKFPMSAFKAASIFGMLHIDAVKGIKRFIRAGRECHGVYLINRCERWGECSFVTGLWKRAMIGPCPIRGTRDVTRTQIITNPISARDFKQREYKDHIGIMLREFWGPDMEIMLKGLFGFRGGEHSSRAKLHVSNLLHRHMANARLALKPLAKREDGSVIVQLFWLKETSLDPKDFLIKPNDSVSFEDILKQAGLENNQDWGPPLAERKDGRKLQSGEMFVLKAVECAGVDEAPDFRLLQLLWDLTRVAAICGAANETEDWIDEAGPLGHDMRRYNKTMVPVEDTYLGGELDTTY